MKVFGKDEDSRCQISFKLNEKMTGILLIAFVLAWLTAVSFMAKNAAKNFARRATRFAVHIAVVVTLSPLPLLDEILARQEFKKLCNEHAGIEIIQPTDVLRAVYLVDQPSSYEYVYGIQIERSNWIFKFTDSDQLAAQYTTFTARSGLLVRILGISDSESPLLFEKFCGPKEIIPTFRSANLEIVSRKNRRINMLNICGAGSCLHRRCQRSRKSLLLSGTRSGTGPL